ncbi:hypothetical protein FRUB_07535 [Fimbriiglobus ruber]|uniref:Uncharacterized protein n=1 Tax=Fimbriiglobus ruber TaxID=1908690 RepID=A0A225DPW7_9BACT|nr:hypothetical protein FRUB_07535 [Fimbriiglobus ruber]
MTTNVTMSPSRASGWCRGQPVVLMGRRSVPNKSEEPAKEKTDVNA